ncbi:MAG TPA: 30S ribosome-binding factor RbfA [Bacteroidia bacterium]
MATLRQNKVSRLIQKELAEIFQKEMRNAFGSGLISVTHVFMSPDLSFAKTFLSIYGAKDKEATLHNVRTQVKEIRNALGSRVRRQLRIVPEIAFFIDESADYAAHIDELLNKIAAPPPPTIEAKKKKTKRNS